MERYTEEERGIIVSDFLANFRSIVLTQREFRRRFPYRPAPCPRTIKRLAERLEQTGSLKDFARSGRPRTARSIENIIAVAENVLESPQTTTRQRCAQLGISKRSLRRILVKDLKTLTDAESSTDVEKIFKAQKIIPDVITVAPNQFLQVTYKNGLLAENGVELTPTQVKVKPQIEWNGESDAFYTLIMIDPDAPSRESPTNREFNHWLVGNIPGSAIDQGEILVDYVGSAPQKGTGLHRYVFLVYKQCGELTFTELHVAKNSSKNRPKFHAAKFAQKYNLGEPIAGNFYQAQWDDYVPTVLKQLSGKKPSPWE